MPLTYRQIHETRAHAKLPLFYLKDGVIPPAFYLGKDGKKDPNRSLYNAPRAMGGTVFAISEIFPNYDYWMARFINAETGAFTGTHYVNPDDELEEMKEGEIVEKFRKSVSENFAGYMLHNFTIGSDPEIFVEDEKGNVIPSWLFLEGKDGNSRTSNLAMYNGKGGQKMYWDGFQAEFCVWAGTCNEYHTDSVAAGLRGVLEAARAKFPNARLASRSVFDIPQEMMDAAAEEHVAFGCMPSYNAWGIAPNLPPGREVPFRSAGGHIHFGLGKMDHDEAQPIVKALDKILGVACVSLFANFDSRKRRHFYGLPGEYRLPPHGLEYRPLSNAWLIHPFIMNLVIDVARKVVVLAQRGWADKWVADDAETIDIVIRSDVEGARAVLEKNKGMFLQLLKACYRAEHAYNWATDTDLEILYNVFANGLESAVADPNDFVKNWRLAATDRSPGAKRWISGNAAANCKVSSAIVTLREGKKI